MQSKLAQRFAVTFAAIWMGFAYVACDDDDDGGATVQDASVDAQATPTVNSGIDPAKPLGQLTPAERQRLCEQSAAALWALGNSPEVEQSACKFVAVLAAQSAAAEPTAGSPLALCESTLQECLSAIGDAGAPESPPDGGVGAACLAPMTGGDAGPDLNDCNATVAEYESCINGLPVGIKQVGSSLSCQYAAADAGTSNLWLTALAGLPISCAVIQQKCPQLLPIGDLLGM